MNAADIILLLISPDYVASEHFEEAQRAMERYTTQETRVIPIILRPTHGWLDEPFGKLQAIPRGDGSLTSVVDPAKITLPFSAIGQAAD